MLKKFQKSTQLKQLKVVLLTKVGIKLHLVLKGISLHNNLHDKLLYT